MVLPKPDQPDWLLRLCIAAVSYAYISCISEKIKPYCSPHKYETVESLRMRLYIIPLKEALYCSLKVVVGVGEWVVELGNTDYRWFDTIVITWHYKKIIMIPNLTKILSSNACNRWWTSTADCVSHWSCLLYPPTLVIPLPFTVFTYSQCMFH